MAVNTRTRFAAAQAQEAVHLRTQSPAAGTVYGLLGTSGSVPTDAATTIAETGVTEYTATGYARVAITYGAATVAKPSVIANTGTPTWGPFTAGTGAIIRYILIVTTSSGVGNVIDVIQLTADRTPATGDSLQAAVGAITASDA
jgi:hypothetical protein